MTELSRFDELERNLKNTYTNPVASPEVVARVQAQLSQHASQISQRTPRPFYLRPAWLVTAGILLVMIISFFAIGPQRVAAAVQKLLGYVPGSGLVSTETPLRVLAEPVEQTRDGVTLTVTSALLSADKTRIEYRVFGIPRSAYPDSEAVSGCFTQPYLRLPDGTRLERMNDYPAVPSTVNEAVLVIPCLSGTLPGKVPENWELPLRFVPAPADLTVFPVEEITPTAINTPIAVASETGTPTPQPETAALNITRVIDTENGYVLLVSFLPGGSSGGLVQQSGMPTITDGAGHKIAYNIPLDIQNSLPADPSGADVMAYQFNASGVTFPVTVHYRGVQISVPQPGVEARFTFNAGASPQAGQEWELNQSVELSGHTLTLVSVNADSRGGYSFHFKTDVHVNGVGVSIDGFNPNGGGGGGGGGMTNGEFNVSLAYAALPTGNLTVVLSNLSEITDELEWTTQWSPSMVRTDIPSSPQLAAGVCADSNTVANLPGLPSSIHGKVLIGQTNTDGSMSLMLVNLDGSGQQVITSQFGWDTVSADGSKIIYSDKDGFALYDIASATTTFLNLGGYNPRLSTSGTKLAYVEDTAAGIDIYDLSSGKNRQLSNQAYSSVVGWSADDSRLYVAVMAAGGSAWQAQSIDVQSGAAKTLFVIENGSYKALNAAISPDGKWIAYRGRNNSDVYMVRVETGDSHLLIENPGLGISGIAWGSNGWLGVSVLMDDTSQKVILVNPTTCETFAASQLNGKLEGLVIK